MVILSIFVLSSALSQMTAVLSADYDNDFANASQMKGFEAAKGTDELIRNTTQVLHQENTAILAEIDKLHKEIADLKKDIKEIKDTVEGGN